MSPEADIAQRMRQNPAIQDVTILNEVLSAARANRFVAGG